MLRMNPTDPRLVVGECRAITSAFDTKPNDEPLTQANYAALREAVKMADTALAALSVTDAASFDPAGYLWLQRATAFALLQSDDGSKEALRSYEKALELDPNHGDAWFDLGLFQKRRGKWLEAFEATKTARKLLGDEKRVMWNLAITATALGRGADAVEAWRVLGIPATVSEGGMPFVEGMPSAALRVVTRGTGSLTAANIPDTSLTFEVLSVAPLSPCHGVVTSPTVREGIVDFGDVVLWDGTPIATTNSDGQLRPTFPLLAKLHDGTEKRFRFLAIARRDEDLEAFTTELAEQSDVFVQSARIERACSHCALASPNEAEKNALLHDRKTVYGKIVLPEKADLKAFRALFERASKKSDGMFVALPGLYEALGETALAGKQHTAWAGIERTHDHGRA